MAGLPNGIRGYCRVQLCATQAIWMRRARDSPPYLDHFEDSEISLVWPALIRRFVCMTAIAVVFGPGGLVSRESFASPGGTRSKRKLPRLSARVRVENTRIGAARFVALAVEEFSTRKTISAARGDARPPTAFVPTSAEPLMHPHGWRRILPPLEKFVRAVCE